jgi:4-amino-4-deoxy-L-arabinose transferase-like glycosyltransferase
MIKLQPLVLLIIGVFVLRLITMAIVPMSGTTEPRYAEIARLMALTNDWITPWFAPEVPFWGKPPLPFWLQAISIKILGLSDFAVRLPSWLLTAGSAWLIFRVGAVVYGPQIGLWAAAIFASSALVYLTLGAVLLDPPLAFGITLTLTGCLMCWAAANPATNSAVNPEINRGQPISWFWRWAPFAGVAIGFLSKGPVTLVLLGVPGFVMLFYPSWRSMLAKLPWLWGTVATAIVVVPWFILAEIKTPGFLNYFFVGEHFLRFTDPGWKGDLYGRAHQEPIGMIWVEGLQATAPWGFALIAVGLFKLAQKTGRSNFAAQLKQSETLVLIAAALSPFLFFTASHNILWTYVLPGLPFLSILIARLLVNQPARLARNKILTLGVIAFPLVVLAAGVYYSANPGKLRSGYSAAQAYQLAIKTQPGTLYYLGKAPFSAWYYTKRELTETNIDSINSLIAQGGRPEGADGQGVYLMLRSADLAVLNARYAGQFQVRYQGQQFALVWFGGSH